MMELGATVCAPQSYSLPAQLEPFFMVHQIAHELQATAPGLETVAAATSEGNGGKPPQSLQLLGASAGGCPVCSVGIDEVVLGLQAAEQHPVALFPCKKPCKETKYATLAVAVLRQLRRDEETGRDHYWYLLTRRPSAEHLAAADAAINAAAAAAPQTKGGKKQQQQKKKKTSALLASQWEFPNVVVSDAPPPAKKPKQKKKKKLAAVAAAPSVAAGAEDGDSSTGSGSDSTRAEALDRTLAEYYRNEQLALSAEAAAAASRAAEAATMQRRELSTPVVHVFSTITHTMYIEVAELPPAAEPPHPLPLSSQHAASSAAAAAAVGVGMGDDESASTSELVDVERWQGARELGREMAWMRPEVEMAAVGLTSNMMKVLAKIGSELDGHAKKKTNGKAPAGGSPKTRKKRRL